MKKGIFNLYLILGMTGLVFMGMAALLETVYLTIPISAYNFKISTNRINFLIGFYLVICNICYNQTKHLLYLELLTRIHLSLTVIGLVGIFTMTVSNEVFYDGYYLGGTQISVLSERMSRLGFLITSLIIFTVGQSAYLFNLVVGMNFLDQKEEREDNFLSPFK